MLVAPQGYIGTPGTVRDPGRVIGPAKFIRGQLYGIEVTVLGRGQDTVDLVESAQLTIGRGKPVRLYGL